MFEALVVSWFLSFGYVPVQTTVVGSACQMLEPSRIATVAELGMRADIDRFSVYASMENYQYFKDKVYFSPYRIDYKAGAEFRFNENIKLVFEHECDHPVASSAATNSKNHTSDYNFLSSETQIKVVITGGLK